MTEPNTNPAHDDFNNWLNNCPVQWLRTEITDEHVVYMFIFPDPETPD